MITVNVSIQRGIKGGFYMKWLLGFVVVILLTMVACGKGKTNDVPVDTKTETVQTTDSPYVGWFKGKTEFSFKSVSVTEAAFGKASIVSTVTSSTFAKNGMEAIKETTASTMGKTVLPTKTLVYITSNDANYVINPDTKKFVQEAGDMNAVMYSKVWQWTRKRSDAYESVSGAGKKETKTINGVEAECYTVQGVLFAYDADKKLLQYNADLSGTKVVINFTDYVSENVDASIFALLEDIKKDGWTKVASSSEL